MMNGRVLLVEDDAEIGELIGEILNSAGYEMIHVRYPNIVLDVARHEQPDLFLIDVMLDQRSGIEVADTLWLNGFAHTPMIAMSASVVMRDLARQSSMFQAVLNKPFDISTLLDTIERALAEAPVSHSHPLGLSVQTV